MNRTRKWLIALFAASFVASMAGFAACENAKNDEKNSEKTVTFYNGDDVYTTATGKTGDDIEAISLPVKTGYEFGGWETEDGSEFVPDKIPQSSVSVYAKYTPNPYSVILDPNGGSGVPVTVDATYDAEVTLPEVTFKKGNGKVYKLTGWATAADADAAEYTVRGSVKNLTAAKDGSVTLFAFYSMTATSEGDFIISDGEIVGYTGNAATLVLPDTCTKVADGAFADNESIREVIIPDTYTDIGFGAFEGCENIEKMTLPFIGGSRTENTFLAYVFGAANYRDNVFAYNLTGVGTGDSTIDMSSLTGSFYIPRGLRIVTINSDIDKIPEGAFYYAFGLEKVIAYRYADDTAGEAESDKTYSYRIKEVGASAFEGCHRIGHDEAADTEYYMAWLQGVEVFGDSCFKGYIAQNDYFTSNLFTVGELTNVRTIGNEAFIYNSMLCDIKFGDKLESIGDFAFTNANLMQRVIIPDSCKSIGESAFEQCIYLGSVTLGSGLKSVGSHAFAYSAALTEVFVKGDLPAALAADAFYGLDINSDTDRMLTDVNRGTVFYFATQAKADAAETGLKEHYPTVSTGVTKAERGPMYYVGQEYDFMLTFSGGHTMIISDPLYRIGFGLPEVVATYERMTDAWYDAEIYTATVMLDIDFTVKLDYYLSAKYTHYYVYRVETFTFDQVRENATAFKVGNKDDDEWYLEENVYGQIGLWHNGEMVGLDTEKGATYVVGGVSQFYDDRGMRTMMYKQGNEYFEPVLEYDFTYVPAEGTQDDMENLVYYGKLYLDETKQHMLFGTYESGDKGYSVFIDEVIKKLRVSKDGETVFNGTYTTDGAYGDTKLTVTATDIESGESCTVNFTDFLDSIVDGNATRSFYARCNFTENGTKHVLYNNKYASYNDCYYINSSGNLSDDHYVLMQYHRRVQEGEGENAYEYELFPGFGEHTYKVSGTQYHDYLTYNYTEGGSGFVYQFIKDTGEPDPTRPPHDPDSEEPDYDYLGTVTDSFVGTFSAVVPGTTSTRTYSPYFVDEVDQTFTNGDISITLSGYGTAIYTNENGDTYNGTYNIASDVSVAQVYVSATTYYNLQEYMFKSSAGDIEFYFVPNFFDAYDGSMHKGDMLLPDESRNRAYRVYDSEGWCTGQFASSGYGMGTFYLMVDPDTALVTDIDNTFFCPGATYAYYKQVGEKNGEPVYRLMNGLDKGFFTFQFTNIATKGHRPDNMSRNFAFDMAVDAEYDDWWRGPAALFVTGDISPDIDEMERMLAREEVGVYTSPTGYTIELDGRGNATLKKPDGTKVHDAKYETLDENRLGVTKYTLEYTVGETKYTGVFDVIDASTRTDALITLELTVDGVVLNNFARGAKKDYTAADGSQNVGTLSLYAGDNVGEYKADGGVNKYALGNVEKDEKTGNHILRFADKKLIVTFSDEDNTYTVVNSYGLMKMKLGDFSCKAYYSWRENEAMTDEDGNDILDDDGNIVPYPHTTLYGYEVRANSKGNPMVNLGSEYRGTGIDTKAGIYVYMQKAYKAEIVCYEDGEFTIAYDHLDIIRITNKGKYVSKDDPENKTGDDLIVVDKGNAICVYTYVGEAVG